MSSPRASVDMFTFHLCYFSNLTLIFSACPDKAVLSFFVHRKHIPAGPAHCFGVFSFFYIKFLSFHLALWFLITQRPLSLALFHSMLSFPTSHLHISQVKKLLDLWGQKRCVYELNTSTTLTNFNIKLHWIFLVIAIRYTPMEHNYIIYEFKSQINQCNLKKTFKEID